MTIQHDSYRILIVEVYIHIHTHRDTYAYVYIYIIGAAKALLFSSRGTDLGASVLKSALRLGYCEIVSPG